MILSDYIKNECSLWERSKEHLAQYNTIFAYTEDYMNDYFTFLENKLKTMTEAQQKNDEKYIKLLMHYTNVYVMQDYFNRGPQRIDHRVVDIYDYWTGIIGAPDFKIYDVVLSTSIMNFYDSWHTFMQSAGLYYDPSQTPKDYVFAGGRAEFEFFKTKDEEQFFDSLVSMVPVWANLFKKMLEDIKDKYVIDFDDIDKSLRNPGFVGLEQKVEDVASDDFGCCDVYVSYPWSDSDMMDEICSCLKKRNIKYYRDKEICGYRKNIQSFEEEIGDGKIVIAIINEKSMASIECMYEVCTLASKGHIEKRLFPIVDLTNMARDSKVCEEYIKTWEDKEVDILNRYKTSTGNKVNELRELKYINCIKTEFPKLWNYISRHNTLYLDLLREDDWKVLIDEVERNIK